MGVPGLESAFAACVTALVEPGVVPLERLAELMSVNPSRRFGLPGRFGITPNAVADLTVADVTARRVFDAEQTFTKSKRSPFDGLTLTGAVCATIVNGFVSNNVDLILANATAPLQAAAQATADIPVLGTSVTDYATALDISD